MTRYSASVNYTMFGKPLEKCDQDFFIPGASGEGDKRQ